MATIREYTVGTRTVGGETVGYAWNRDDDPSILRFSPIPTLEEVRNVVGVPIDKIDLWGCFNPNNYVKAFPKIPPADTLARIDSMFSYCVAMTVAPALPEVSEMDGVFDGCRNLLVPAVIPKTATNVEYLYSNCDNLKSPASIPRNVTNLCYAYRKAPNIEGEMILRMPTYPTSWRGDYFLRDTTKPLTLYGDQAVCQAAAATANNHNAAWAPWYDPVPAVTDRGQGSYTTAADITRMVRNGALAVPTYAPGRMVYQQGDIVREDEWIALVEAAKTIDPTITLSTNYMNLNKIEAAFESAL